MGSGFEGANDLCFDTSRLQSQPQGSNPSLQASIPALRLQSQLQGSKPHFPSNRLKIQCSHQSYPISYNSIQNCFLHALTNFFTKRYLLWKLLKLWRFWQFLVMTTLHPAMSICQSVGPHLSFLAFWRFGVLAFFKCFEVLFPAQMPKQACLHCPCPPTRD